MAVAVVFVAVFLSFFLSLCPSGWRLWKSFGGFFFYSFVFHCFLITYMDRLWWWATTLCCCFWFVENCVPEEYWNLADRQTNTHPVLCVGFLCQAGGSTCCKLWDRSFLPFLLPWTMLVAVRFWVWWLVSGKENTFSDPDTCRNRRNAPLRNREFGNGFESKSSLSIRICRSGVCQSHKSFAEFGS